MAIPYKKIADLLTTTYDNIQVGIMDLSQELHDYIVMPYLMTKQGGLREIGGGVGIGQLLMIEHGGRSRFVGEYDEDVIIVIDHLDKARVDFCLMTDNVAFSIGELRANRGKELIENCVKPKKRAVFLRMIETMEEAFFKTPDADDDLTPWGLKYWITKNATAGFNGGYASGFSSIANLNLTKIPQFKNYTDQYTDVSKTDLITKMRRAHRRTNWKTPRTQEGFKGDTTDKRIILANEATVESFENIGEAQNENLGRDLAPMDAGRLSGLRKTPDGDIVFKRKPIVYAEYLDDDTSNPVYGLDMSYFYPVVRKGDNMAQGPFEKAPKQHRVMASHIDHCYQFICINRRAQWVISK
jgi:hypothetical protein